MKVLYIFNYQREIPPFMQMQIEIAKDYFDKIIYVTRTLTNDNSDTIDFRNVSVRQVPSILRSVLFLVSFIRSFFNWYIIKAAIRNKDLKLFKSLATTLFMSDCLYFTAKNSIARDIKNGVKVYLLATWFASEAYTVGRLNRNLHPIKAISYAHSFEIDPDKNRYVAHSFNEFKHENIDEVYYISHKMKEIYYNQASKLNIREKYDSKAHVVYLGSVKRFATLCQPSDDGIFRLISCSGVTPVKRIHLIAEALKTWTRGKIHWTHLGGGPLFDDMERLCTDVVASNENVSIELAGWKNNIEVQRYYTENPVDIFINVSEAEGLPVSIMEAMSYGIPCIATNVGGTGEIVTDQTGFLLSKECTPSEIKKTLEKFIKLNPDERDLYRYNSFDMWRNHFDTQKTMNDFYRNMVAD